MKLGLGPQQLVPSLTSGLVIGMVEIIIAISFATLIFTGSLGDYLPLGIGIALVGTILTTAVITLFTSLPGTIGGNQDVPAAIMGVAAAGIVAAMPAGSTPQEIVITVLATIIVITLLTGFFFLAIGYFRLGGLVRFLPYPVVGGFLAGTGWLLVTGAMSMMIELPQSWRQVSVVLQSPAIFQWLPGVILALIILIAFQRFDNFLILPGILFGSLILFYGITWAASISLEQLSMEGWLLGPFTNELLWRPFPLDALATVYWPAIVRQAANVGAIILVSGAGLLLNAGGVELATEKDMDLNRELRAAGLANILSGLASGLIGYHQLSLSALNFKLRANNRLTGLIAVLVSILALMFGADLLSLMPKFIFGGLLLFLGLSFLVEWVIEAFFKLPRIDYVIVASILLVTITVGFLEAVALGLLQAIILFVVGYSQVETIRNQLTGATYKSRVSRPRQQARFLLQEGDRLYIVQLQGFIFFGTADQLLNQVRQRLVHPELPKPLAIYLDFRRVTGLDTTALLSFRRMKQLTQAKEITLVFIGPSQEIRHQFDQGGLKEDGDRLRFFDSLDRGIQWGEDRLLAEGGGLPTASEAPLLEQLAEMVPDESQLPTLFGYFERMEVAAGYKIITMGDRPGDLFIVESGQLTAQVTRPGLPPLRLQTMGSGHVIGEIGFYLGQKRTAEVIVDEPSVVYRLSLADLQRIEQTDPEAASLLHRLMVHLLAERLTHLTDAFNAIEH